MMRFPELEAWGAALAVFSDRSDGDCAAHSAAVNTRKRFLEQCGVSIESLACPRQVHGNHVAIVGASDPGRGGGPANVIGDADAVISNVAGIALGVAVADCVPVYLVAKGGGVGGLVHAGRQGTFLNIAGNAVRAIEGHFAVPAEGLCAVIGPSAGPCCYEVSEAMAENFAAAGGIRRGRVLDLWETNRRQLAEAGLPEAQILVIGRCTICDGAFYSYRASGTKERNLAVLALRP